jgi:hypothetical protein
MFRYRLRLADGSDAGEATYPVMIRPGEEIIVGNNRRFRVLDLIPSRTMTRRTWGCCWSRPRRSRRVRVAPAGNF